MTEEEELQFALALSLNSEQPRPSTSRSPSPIIPQQTLRPELPSRTMSIQDQLAEVRRQRARHYQDHQVDQAVEATKGVPRMGDTKAGLSKTAAGAGSSKKRALEETGDDKATMDGRSTMDEEGDDDNEIEFVGIKKVKAEPKQDRTTRVSLRHHRVRPCQPDQYHSANSAHLFSHYRHPLPPPRRIPYLNLPLPFLPSPTHPSA
jgi:hypothetical protein